MVSCDACNLPRPMRQGFCVITYKRKKNFFFFFCQWKSFEKENNNLSEASVIKHVSIFFLISKSFIFCCRPVSGGSLNPARSLGPAILSWKFKNIWIYMLAPSSGAVAGAAMFRFLRLRDQHSSTLSSPNINDVACPIPFCSS